MQRIFLFPASSMLDLCKNLRESHFVRAYKRYAYKNRALQIMA